MVRVTAHNVPLRVATASLPAVPRVALFETAFYQWVPEAATRYAVPQAWHDAGVRRYGFHGASHKFIAERSAELLGRPDVAAVVQRRIIFLRKGFIDNRDTRPAAFRPFDSVECGAVIGAVAAGLHNDRARNTKRVV